MIQMNHFLQSPSLLPQTGAPEIRSASAKLHLFFQISNLYPHFFAFFTIPTICPAYRSIFVSSRYPRHPGIIHHDLLLLEHTEVEAAGINHPVSPPVSDYSSTTSTSTTESHYHQPSPIPPIAQQVCLRMKQDSRRDSTQKIIISTAPTPPEF